MSDEHKPLTANPIRSQFGGILKGKGVKVFGEEIWKGNVFHSLGIVGAVDVCLGVLPFGGELSGRFWIYILLGEDEDN
jgi:hypothetical protein